MAETSLTSTSCCAKLMGDEHADVLQESVVGIYPNDAIVHLVGALLIQQNAEWLIGRRDKNATWEAAGENDTYRSAALTLPA